MAHIAFVVGDVTCSPETGSLKMRVLQGMELPPSLGRIVSEFSKAWVMALGSRPEAGAWRQPELCRQHGISPQTFYRWKAKFGVLDVSEARRLKKLEEENTKLKRLVADLTLDNQALKDLASGNF